MIFVIPRGLGKIGNKLLEYLDISSDADTAGMEWKKMPMFFSFNRRSSKLVVSPRGVMFEIGGYSRTRAILNNVDALDLTKVNRKWIPKSPLGLARLFFAVCMSEDKIFVVSIHCIVSKQIVIAYYCNSFFRWVVLLSTQREV